MGLIAVMHPRGSVNREAVEQDPIVRASVWVEQEIAIAAFLRQAMDRQIEVLSYIHRDIAREGVREQLLLNSTFFSDGGEVLENLARVLPQWRPASEPELPVKIWMESKRTESFGGGIRDNYQLAVKLRNRSDSPVKES